MRWYKIAVLTVGVGALACQSTPRLTTASINIARDQIQVRLRDWERFINNRMIDSALTIYHDNDALQVGWSDGRLTEGMEAYAAELDNFYNSIQFVNLNVQSPTVDVHGAEIATVYFRYSIDMQLNDTSRDPYSGLGLQLWTKDPEDGLWRLQHHMMSRN